MGWRARGLGTTRANTFCKCTSNADCSLQKWIPGVNFRHSECSSDAEVDNFWQEIHSNMKIPYPYGPLYTTPQSDNRYIPTFGCLIPMIHCVQHHNPYMNDWCKQELNMWNRTDNLSILIKISRQINPTVILCLVKLSSIQ